MVCKKYLLLAVLLIFLTSCTKTESARTWTELALGTVCTVTIFERVNEDVYNKIFSRIHEIENRMSVNIPSSDVSRINAAAGIKPVQVHEDVFAVIKRSVLFAELSDGAFDPSIGALVSLWGIAGDNPRVPLPEEIGKTLPLINWRSIELNEDTFTVFLKEAGMALDLGAIAKGYAADEAAAIIKDAGVKRAIIDLGGDIVLCGGKRDGSPWRVSIQKPFEERGVSVGILQIPSSTKSTAAVTSGVYERFFESDGRQYHHIFSPSSGYPADTGLLSVTIIAHNTMDADALSTAVFVLGYEKGRELLEIMEAEAVFVFNDNTVIKTSDVDFSLRDSTFQMADIISTQE